MDGYACHMSYKTIYIIRNYSVLVDWLPTHTSHVLLSLDYSVFSALKKIKRLLSRRTITTSKDTFNNVFTIYEVLWNAYNTAVTPRNEISGFRGTGIWNNETHRIDPGKVKMESFTTLEVLPQCLQNLTTTRSFIAIIESTEDPTQRKIKSCMSSSNKGRGSSCRMVSSLKAV